VSANFQKFQATFFLIWGKPFIVILFIMMVTKFVCSCCFEQHSQVLGFWQGLPFLNFDA